MRVDSVSTSQAVLCWDPPVYGTTLRYTLTYWDRESPPLDASSVTTTDTCVRVYGLEASHSYTVTVAGRDGNGNTGPHSPELVFLAGFYIIYMQSLWCW